MYYSTVFKAIYIRMFLESRRKRINEVTTYGQSKFQITCIQHSQYAVIYIYFIKQSEKSMFF